MKYHSPDPEELKRREQLHEKLQQTARTRRWMGYVALPSLVIGMLLLAVRSGFERWYELEVLWGVALLLLGITLLGRMAIIRGWELEQLGEEGPDVRWMRGGF